MKAPHANDCHDSPRQNSEAAALKHPAGLTILILTLLIAACVRLLPFHKDWGGVFPWLLLWGAVTYLVSILVIVRFKSAKLSAKHQCPDTIGASIGENPASRDHRLGDETEGRVNGGTPKHSIDASNSVRMEYARQRRAIESCIERLANIAESLDVSHQKQDLEHGFAAETPVAEGLVSVPANGQNEQALEAAQSSYGKGVGLQLNVPPTTEPERNGPVANRSTIDADDFKRFEKLVHESLRKLNNQAALSNSELIEYLPLTLSPGHAGETNSESIVSTNLEQAQTLRAVLVDAIELLKPASTESGSAPREIAEPYMILKAAYVENRPGAYIWTHLNISEANYHKKRRSAISAVAQHLLNSEERAKDGKFAEVIL